MQDGRQSAIIAVRVHEQLAVSMDSLGNDATTPREKKNLNTDV